VAYVVYSPEPRFYTEIYTMNPDGSDQRQITSDGGDFLGKVDVGIENPIDMYSSNSQPRWSPDGSQLAFLAKVALDQDEVRVVDAHGSNMRVLFDDWEGSMFSWSPDGTQIAYTTEEGVRIANADGSSSELLLATSPIAIGPAGPTTATFSARWSADGRWIAFIEATGEGYVAGVEFVTIADLATGSVARGICVEQRNQAIDWHPSRAAATRLGLRWQRWHRGHRRRSTRRAAVQRLLTDLVTERNRDPLQRRATLGGTRSIVVLRSRHQDEPPPTGELRWRLNGLATRRRPIAGSMSAAQATTPLDTKRL
jgi:dipeptidyl aminopeptidase/acylaminoacyl peptidase